MSDTKRTIRFVQQLTHAARVLLEWGEQKIASDEPLTAEEDEAVAIVEQAMPEIERLTTILRKPGSRP